MKILLACLTTLLLTGSVTQAQTRNQLDQLFEDACRLSVYSCFGVERPKVIFMPLKAGLSGLFISGTAAVYLNTDLQYGDPTHAKQVLVHEYVHFLQWKYKALTDRCAWEAEAFAVSNLYVVEQGRQDLRRRDWRELYGC